MRKIIQGKLYDTESATLVATNTYLEEEDGVEFEVKEDLYRTKRGALFLIRPTGGSDIWTACTRDEAERWFKTGTNVDLHDHTVFAEPAEASAADVARERFVNISMRVPISLRNQLAAAAAKERLSINRFMIGCFERRLKSQA